MNILKGIKTCTGCGVCYNVCPKNAISMIQSEEGFLYPNVDEALCSNCGLCKKICPVLNPEYKNFQNPKCYVAAANDELRKDSSSGAVFPVIAEYILNAGGFVCGAAYTEDNLLEHVIINKKEDLYKLKSSKYFQSNTTNVYSKIKDLLDKNSIVLFSGTPCQIAGLNAFLGDEYENLLTLDIVCHGVPSPMVYKKYLTELIGDKNEKVLFTNFRDKLKGWSPYLITTTTTTTTITTPAENDDFMKAFLGNISLRESCFECPFQNIPRQGDITIGDCWGIDAYKPELNDDKGLSIAVINSQKGLDVFNKIKDNFIISEEAPLEMAKNGNPCLYKSVEKNTQNRALFFDLIKNNTLKNAVKTCIDDYCDYVIVNFWWSGGNYGAVLTAYALQQYLKELGLTSKLLDTGEYVMFSNYGTSCFYKFAREFLNVSKKYSYSELKCLSQNIKGAIVGSDQVFRIDYITAQYQLNKYLLEFLNIKNKKIAISGSFGVGVDEVKKALKIHKKIFKKMKNAYGSFDYISTRELSGKTIFKEIFNLNSDFILDPVFLVDIKAFDKIIEKSRVGSGNIVSYILDFDEKIKSACDYLKQKLNADIVNIDAKEANISVEDWLAYIAKSKFVITDSFHGVCFALLYNKPFVCIKNTDRGEARFNSLIEVFGIKNNFVNSAEEIYKLNLCENIDYDKFNQKLKEEVERCRNIIRDVLVEDKTNNDNAYNNKARNEFYKKISNMLKVKQKIKILRCKSLAKVFPNKKAHYTEKINRIKEEMSWNL